MSVERARVIKGAFPEGSTVTTRPAFVLGRRIPREAMDARDDAQRILEGARREGEAMIAEARANAAKIGEDTAKEARERETAKLAAAHLALRAAEERRADRELDRILEAAVLLAERLVGEALRVEPERIAALATEVLREARGARRVRIEASPADAEPLARLLAEATPGIAEVAPNAELGRGSLVVHTELGRIDARLDPQLARLAEALREALRGGGDSGSSDNRGGGGA